MYLRSWMLAASMAVVVATTSDAAGPQPADADCGHIEELLAARRALEAGDKEGALRHLKNADALLSMCIRYGVPAPEGEGGSPDTRTG